MILRSALTAAAVLLAVSAANAEGLNFDVMSRSCNALGAADSRCSNLVKGAADMARLSNEKGVDIDTLRARAQKSASQLAALAEEYPLTYAAGFVK